MDIREESFLKEGVKVEVYYQGKGKWYEGKIKKVREDGSYDVLFDDGDSEASIERALIRLWKVC